MDRRERKSKRGGRVLAWVLLAAVGCRASMRPPGSASGLPAAPAAICPIVPLALTVRAPAAPPRAIISLDAEGNVSVSLLPGQSLAAVLTGDGCLADSDGLWAEWAPGDRLWTAHETWKVASKSCLALAGGATLCLQPDGRVMQREANGAATSDVWGTMQIVGYDQRAACAGLLLLGTFLALTPSMAVVDGRPVVAPAPTGSRCARFRRPR
jgi:hypothetical protein